MLKVIIEIPKGCDRRIHFSQEKNDFVDFGPIKEKIPVNGGKMPVHYGFLDGIINKKEGDEVDALIFSEKDFKTGNIVEIIPIALILREDGDDKIVVIDEMVENIKEWDDVDEKEKKLILDYFGFRHKIISVKNSKSAVEYITK
jgi:inorganic pyrophosphatase